MLEDAAFILSPKTGAGNTERLELSRHLQNPAETIEPIRGSFFGDRPTRGSA
jgi:hypothetical protein